MAKKTPEQQTKEKGDVTKFFAFWGLAIATVLFIVTAVLNTVRRLCDISSGALESCLSVLDIIAKVALLIAIGIPAHRYVKGKSIGWKVFYWIAIAIFVLSIVLGNVFLY